MRENRYQNIQAIILKKNFLGENDISLTLFSPTLGKFQAIARASRKITSTRGTHLDLLNLISLQTYQKQERHILIQCQTINSYQEIKNNIQTSLVAQILAEIMLRSTDGIEDAAIHFNLLQGCLETLSKSHNLLLNLEQFKIKLLDQLGLLPNLNSCPSCNLAWPLNTSLHLQSNHFLICQNCSTVEHQNSLTTIPFGVLKLLKFLAETKFNEIKILISPEDLIKLQLITRQLFSHHLHQELKAEKILATIGSIS